MRASNEDNLNGICVGACHGLLAVMGTSHLGAADSGVRIGRAGVSHSTPVSGGKPANRRSLSDAVGSRFCTVAGKDRTSVLAGSSGPVPSLCNQIVCATRQASH